MIDFADVSGAGNANGYLEYSSTTVSMYLFEVLEGSGPLKSIFNLSNAAIALIRYCLSLGLKNRGLSSEHSLQVLVICFTSLTE